MLCWLWNVNYLQCFSPPTPNFSLSCRENLSYKCMFSVWSILRGCLNSFRCRKSTGSAHVFRFSTGPYPTISSSMHRISFQDSHHPVFDLRPQAVTTKYKSYKCSCDKHRGHCRRLRHADTASKEILASGKLACVNRQVTCLLDWNFIMSSFYLMPTLSSYRWSSLTACSSVQGFLKKKFCDVRCFSARNDCKEWLFESPKPSVRSTWSIGHLDGRCTCVDGLKVYNPSVMRWESPYSPFSPVICNTW